MPSEKKTRWDLGMCFRACELVNLSVLCIIQFLFNDLTD